MLSRRLIFKTMNSPYLHFSAELEKLDNYLGSLKYLSPVNNIISIYGARESQDLRIGREITGREEESYFHEDFKIEDYHKAENQLEVIKAESLVDLRFKISELTNSYNEFRVQWDLSKSGEFQVYFF